MAPDEERDNRIVVANGVDINKRYFYEVSKRISLDADLWKLSLLGPPLWALTLLVGAGLILRSAVSSVPAVLQQAFSLTQTIVLWLGADESTRRKLRERILTEVASLSGITVEGPPGAVGESFAFVLVFLALALLSLPFLRKLTTDALRGSVETLGDAASFVSNVPVVFRPETWQNFNYWHPFTSHLSDRDPLVILGNDDAAAVSSTFADDPHYGNVFVDSVYVEVDDDSTVRRPLLFALFGARLRPLWRTLVALAAGVLVLTLADAALVFDLLVFRSVLPWNRMVLASGGFLVACLVVPLATLYTRRYVGFLHWFYANSAGLSSYSDLLNPKEVPSLVRDEDRNVLSNSLSGYGLFYLSEFFFQVFGAGRYEIDCDHERLAASDEPMRFYDDIDGTRASLAAAELLWSAIPAESVAAAHDGRGDDADVTVRLAGVDYYRTERAGPGLVGRLLGAIGYPIEDGNATRLTKATTGSKRGIRLPVKKFMSVADRTDPDALNEGPKAVASLYEADEWANDDTHTLLLGGGEHQQGLNKLVLSMKAEGYDNVDVLENAFTGQRQGDRERADDPSDDTIAATEFPTEYFVSFVGGDTAFLRDVADDSLEDRGVFLLLYHQTDENPDRFVHVLVGMSAVATKTGFLYWYDRFRGDGLSDLQQDTLYAFHHPDPTGDTGLDADSFTDLEIGRLYLDTSWLDAGRLDFEMEPDRSYEWVTSEHGIDIEYHELGIAYDSPATDD